MHLFPARVYRNIMGIERVAGSKKPVSGERHLAENGL